MEKLLSNKNNIKSVPKSYVLQPENRPGNLLVPKYVKVPVIDIGGENTSVDRPKIVHQIIKACEEYGFFQLINHGISEELVKNVLNVAKEFFELPDEDKADLYSEDRKKSCRLYASIDYDNEKVHYWRDCMRQSCHPLQENIHGWPTKPSQYREVIGKYSVEARKLMLRILDLIGEGLNLEPGFFNNDLSEIEVIYLNYYPPCPDPSLTLGLPKHSDSGIITLLLQGDIPGLQVLEDGQWFTIQPVPGAFVVNIADMLHFISNGRLKSADHRVVTNKKVGRATITSFIHPSETCCIEPAKALIKDGSPLLYRPFPYRDYVPGHIADTQEGKCPLDRYKIQP